MCAKNSPILLQRAISNRRNLTVIATECEQWLECLNDIFSVEAFESEFLVAPE
jgi:hypothetical protein